MSSVKWRPFFLSLNVLKWGHGWLAHLYIWAIRYPWLTHWGWVTHICVSNLTIIGSDNGLSPGRRQAIIWTNAGILLIRTLGTNFSEILGEIHSFSFSKIHLKMSSAKWRLFGLGLNELTHCGLPVVMPYGDIDLIQHLLSHYLNQCWLFISEVVWHSSEGNFTRDTSAINPWN